MHTESEATKLFCPMVRESLMEGCNRDGREHYATCIASGCAMWRWDQGSRNAKTGIPSRGWCGLAGKPGAG